MFSKKLLTIFCLILLVLVNILLLSIGARHDSGNSVLHGVVMTGIAPLQECVMQGVRFCRHVWGRYFDLVNISEECDRLRQTLAKVEGEKRQSLETELSCQRLRKLLDLENGFPQRTVAAEVIGIDPSGWYNTIVVNRGTDDGVDKGMPVVAPEGIVGQIATASYGYSKILLIVDPASAVDGLVQRTRARGIVEGEIGADCRFKYVIRKADVEVGDVVVSSGLDRLFPKGLPVGTVSEVSKSPSGIFQEVRLRPFVDFAKLEEVLILLQ